MRILHQAGHNAVWNIDSFLNDNAGDGVILPPRYERRGRVEELDQNVKQNSLFDPQFFLPSEPMGKLDTYEFHPHNISEGFDTQDFSGTDAANSAAACVAFQVEQEFRHVIIPTRYVEGMPTDLIDQMMTLFVDPYLEAIANVGLNDHQGILLQLVLNSGMIKDEKYRSDILNWVTGLQTIDGIYVLVEKEKRYKQVEDVEYLYQMLRFINALRQAAMDVVVGYCNTEGILYSVADPTDVTMGSYENMRIFRIDTFQETGRAGPPTPRLFSTRLLQWVDHNYIDAIEDATGIPKEEYFEQNKYKSEVFDEDLESNDDSFEWHFTKPSIYKHFFVVYDNLVSSVPNTPGKTRFEYVSNKLQRAESHFDDIGRQVVFDREGGRKHLPRWRTALNQFANYKGWL